MPHPAVLQSARRLLAVGSIGVCLASPMHPGRGASATAALSASAGGHILASSGDAYVREERTSHGMRWTFGTAQVERQIELANGHLALVHWIDRTTQHEYVQGPSDVVRFLRDTFLVTGQSVSWTVDKVTTQRLRQGELVLHLAMHAANVGIVKSYVLYPQESIIQEWLQVTNLARQPVVVDQLASLEMHVLQHEVADLDLSTMTGDEHWQLQTRPLPTDQAYDAIGGAPIVALHNRVTETGLFLGWDYDGSARALTGNSGGRPVHLGFEVIYGAALQPGESVETPKAFTGFFHGDLDEMSHQLLDYQYRYKWEYTRDAYFPRTGIEGYWAAGSSYGPAVGGTGGVFDPVATYRKVFHDVDFMRAIGGELYWRDNGWWDHEGDWNGPDFGETHRYLTQYGMEQIIYLPIQDASDVSLVSRQHPDWLPHGILDQSHPGALDWELKLLESKQRLWGDFQWRKDWVSFSGDASELLHQEQGYRSLIRTFLDRNPGMGYYGNTGTAYEMIELSSTWGVFAAPCPPDATSGSSDDWAHQQMYGISYIFPPDKMEDMPDRYNPMSYEKRTWRSMVASRVPFIGETEDPEKLEGVRLLIDINHYLRDRQVIGRWTWVYHPRVTGDSADWYLQRLSRDGRRGIVALGHAVKRPITIFPKGLLPTEMYTVSFQESAAMEHRTGADLLEHGITIASVPDGEILYLNLPLHPGSPLDRTPPTAPTHVTAQLTTHMDYSGVELRWSPGHDDNWVSYYQILRNGVTIGITATGTYYFDHALGADLAAQYSVVTVDGSGNRSAPAMAPSVSRPAEVVVDDSDRALVYTGRGWTHETGQWSVAGGTQSRTNTKDDTVQYRFTGSQVTWYGRMGQQKGIAAVYLDGQLDRLVNTYAADEIPNIAVYSRVFPDAKTHTLSIVSLGAQTGVAKGASKDSTQRWIMLDGVQVRPVAPRVVGPFPSAGIVYRGAGWRVAAASENAPSQNVSSNAGDSATYTFTGHRVTWVGRRCEQCGMADVYLDGKHVTSVDTYVEPVAGGAMKSDVQQNVPIFTQEWPSTGTHTLTIVVRGDANLWARGHMVSLTALHIEP